jgi:23S rRNA pseudouridine1911/1915/1917 synthase
VTHYRVVERYRAHTLTKILLETGRTHQIRVHMSHRGYPLVGDKIYGARPILPKGASPALITAIRGFTHQALHAKILSFKHPVTDKLVQFEAPLPEQLQNLIDLLRANKKEDE